MVRFLAAPAFAAALVLIVLPAFAAVSEDYDQTLPLAADGSLEIDNVNGSVVIQGWDRDEIRIHAVKHAADTEGLADIRIEVESSARAVEIDARLPKDKKASVDYTITLPAGAAVEADLVNGPLEVEGVQGRLELTAVNGSLTVKGAHGPVEAEAVNGEMAIGFARIEADTSAELESVNGRISLFLPAGVEGSFEAETVNGGIETDFPLEVRKARFGPMSTLEGRLGEGGGRFETTTVNGKIRILSTENVDARVVEYHLDKVR